MDENYKRGLERNLWRYTWTKTFAKRVYFPILAIMQISIAHLSYDQIALVAIVASITQGILQIPTGYLADKLGDKKMMVIGAVVMLPATLFYIFMPNFWGSLLGLMSFSGGLAFISGAMESFIHDTLVGLGRSHEYTKAVGRAQSLGLIGNVVLVALTPLTYAIDYRLPFAIGFLCSVANLYMIATMVVPPPRRTVGTANPLEAMMSVVTWQNISLFLFAGFLGGVVERGSDYTTLLFHGVGIADNLFGLIVAVSGIFGAILGWYLHVFDRLKPLQFYFFDLLVISLCFWSIGLTHSAIVVITSFIVLLGYIRVRIIVIQSKLLQTLEHTYKATLLSALSFFNLFGGILAVTIISRLINQSDVFTGHMNFGIVIAGISFALWLFIWRSLASK